MDNNFLLKLRELSGSRDLTPWLKSLGFTDGVVGKVLKGQSPSADLLRALYRSERVSMRWLEDDVGPPYFVWRISDDHEAKTTLEAHIEDESWSVLLATDDEKHFTVILHQPGAYSLKVKGKSELRMVEYRIVEVLAGNITLDTVHWLDGISRANWVLPLTESEMQRLSNGYMGNMELFGFEDARKHSEGLEKRKTPGLTENIRSTLHDSSLRYRIESSEPDSSVADPRAKYQVNESREAEMSERFKLMTAEQQAAVLNLIRVFTKE